MKFQKQVDANIQNLGHDNKFNSLSCEWIKNSAEFSYSYNFRWMGLPIIQYPQDIVAMQELIWSVKPDLIIETGIARGGSLVFSASMLGMLEYAEAAEKGALLDFAQPKRKVLGIDIDIRAHNRETIEKHPMFSRIEMLEGSSIDEQIIGQVRTVAEKHKTVLVCLDSNHTHDHVLAELEAYAPLVSKGSYCVVFDTIVEDLPAEMFTDRPWGKSDNPKTAVHQYLTAHKEFEIDETIHNKLQITVAPDGYLKRIF